MSGVNGIISGMSKANIPDNTGKTYNTSKVNYKAQMFATFYMQPTSTTFQNVRGSALRAGYSEDYASNITNVKPKWWVELQASSEYERAEMLALAQNNLKERLKDKGDDKDTRKLQTDVSKFVAERVGKDHYSSRQELTDKGGRKLFTNETKVDADVPLEAMFVGIEEQEGDA